MKEKPLSMDEELCPIPNNLFEYSMRDMEIIFCYQIPLVSFEKDLDEFPRNASIENHATREIPKRSYFENIFIFPQHIEFEHSLYDSLYSNLF